MMAHILSLPQEIQIRIFTYLDHLSLLRSASTCRSCYQTFKESLELQYIFELSKDGMVDAGSLHLRADILSRLCDLRGAWDLLDWKQLTKSLLREDDSHFACDLAAGVFAISDHHGLKFIHLPSPTFDNQPLQHQRCSFEVPIKDFAIDPTQDVIAILENIHFPILPTHGRDRYVHLRTISSNQYHPLATNKIFTFTIAPDAGDYLPSCSLRLAKDILSLFLRHGSLGAPGKARVLLWNWQQGNLVYDSDHSVTKLPPQFKDFGLLSRNSFAVTASQRSGVIFLYRFLPSALDLTLPPPPPTVAAMLSLPSIHGDCAILDLAIHSGRILGGPPLDSLFFTSNDSRIQAISLSYTKGKNYLPLPACYWLFVHTSVFLDYIHRNESGSKGANDSELVVQWEDWGEMNTRFIPYEPETDYFKSKYVHGQRVVLQSERSISVDVMDFSASVKANADANSKPSDRPSASTDSRSSDTCRIRTCSGPTCISAGSLFQHDVVTRLPYRMSTRSVGQWYFAMLMDQEHLIGLKTTGGNGIGLDAYSF